MDFSENRFSIKQVQKSDSEVLESTASTAGSETTSFKQAARDMRGSVVMKRRKTVDQNVKLEDFDILSQLGRGTFGRVYLGELDKNGKKTLYAIKAIRKDVLIEYDQVQSTMLEKDIMFEADHPFLVGMDYLF